MSTEELLARVLRLPRTEHARLAEGRVQTVDGDTAHLEILKDLEHRRADFLRSASRF